MYAKNYKAPLIQFELNLPILPRMVCF